ncbi:MAG TPA: hypothetical protein PKD69_07170 [Elusimicrobiota bacterium]|nr:hypothetical protein [Elusimicrobiota bacterium]
MKPEVFRVAERYALPVTLVADQWMRVPGFAAALAAVQRALGSTGRTLIRYSGTEPLLRVMVEGPDHAAIERHAQALARAAVR